MCFWVSVFRGNTKKMFFCFLLVGFGCRTRSRKQRTLFFFVILSWSLVTPVSLIWCLFLSWMRCLTITKKNKNTVTRQFVIVQFDMSTAQPRKFFPFDFWPSPHQTRKKNVLFLFLVLLPCCRVHLWKKKTKFCDEMIILTITSLIVYCTGIGHQVTKSSLALAVSLPSINNFHSDAELEELRPSEEEIGGLAR